MTFADKLKPKFSFTVGGDKEPDGDEPDDSQDETAAPAKPGEGGKMLMKAIRLGDAEAVEEAVRQICG